MSGRGRVESVVPLLGGDDDEDVDEDSKGMCSSLCAPDESQLRVDKMWNANKKMFNDEHAKVNFIDYVNVRFSADSGFSDIPEIWDAEKGGKSMKSRWFSAILSMIFVIYNTHFIIGDNVMTLQSNTTVGDPDFYLVRCMIDNFQDASGVRFPTRIQSVVNNNAKLIACLELLGMFLLYKRVIFDLLCRFLPGIAPGTCGLSPEKQDRAKWFADIRLFWCDLHAISIYSGMRLLNYIQPPVLSMDISHIMSMKPSHKAAAWTKFIIWRVICLVVGFDFFLKKFRDADVSGVFSEFQDDPWTGTQVLRSFMFMRQVMGVVQVDVLIRDRLFVFVFGGEESHMDRRELTIKAIWQALIARRIWRDSLRESEGNHFSASMKYSCIMLTFSDEDFQHLTLDPRKEG